MAANNISTLATKEQRQVAKLNLASSDRAATGRPSTYDRELLPSKYVGNTVVDNDNTGSVIGGTITAISVVSPLTRSDGQDYLNPGNVTVTFANPSAGGGYGTDKATGTPIITSGKLTGITLTYGGTGYVTRNDVTYVTPGSLLDGQVNCDVFIIDSTPGDPDSRELRDITLGLDITLDPITSVTSGLQPGRPWS